MKWYSNAILKLAPGVCYSHKDITGELKKTKQNLSNSAYYWAVREMIQEGSLYRLGYDSYSLPTDSPKSEYKPHYSEQAASLIDTLSQAFPHVAFTVFETVLLNDFLNHLIARNTVFLQVEKESSAYVFRYLQESGTANVLFCPNKAEFDLYWSDNCVVVIDMISEAPLCPFAPHSILLEKMLVDICADKLIAGSFSKAELPDIYEQASAKYRIDKAKLMRYARRRNKQNEAELYLERSDGKDDNA